MIIFDNVSAGYGKKTVLSDVAFTAASGEITVLLGKNGSGKSTLLGAASGNVKYSGSITADGAEVSRTKASLRSRMIAVMPQLLKSPGIDVRELVSFGRQPYAGLSGILSRRDREVVEEVIAAAGLEALAGERMDAISGGERQKAYFAMIMAQNTPNILLDEPGSHLDAEYMKRLCAFLADEKSRGKTVLAVLHDINRALEIADRVVVLSGGTLYYSGTPDEFCATGIPEDIFGMRKFICADDSGAEKILYQ